MQALMQAGFPAKTTAVCMGSALIAVACIAQDPAKENRMMASVWSLADEQLSRAQAKITYLGEQTKPIPTVAFAVEGHKIAMARFLEVQHSRKPYVNDEISSARVFFVSRDEFRHVLAGLQSIAEAGPEEGPAFLSFAVLTGSGAALIGHEYFIPKTRGKQFYARLLEALPPDRGEARAIVQSQFKNVLPE